jgi:hypothetical protein
MDRCVKLNGALDALRCLVCAMRDASRPADSFYVVLRPSLATR